MTVSDVDLFELNEAFAAVGVASMRDLGITDDVVNVNGGAIALGHPVGMSGTRDRAHADQRAAPPRRRRSARPRSAAAAARATPRSCASWRSRSRASAVTATQSSRTVIAAGPCGSVCRRRDRRARPRRLSPRGAVRSRRPAVEDRRRRRRRGRAARWLSAGRAALPVRLGRRRDRRAARPRSSTPRSRRSRSRWWAECVTSRSTGPRRPRSEAPSTRSCASTGRRPRSPTPRSVLPSDTPTSASFGSNVLPSPGGLVTPGPRRRSVRDDRPLRKALPGTLEAHLHGGIDRTTSIDGSTVHFSSEAPIWQPMHEVDVAFAA